MIELSNEQLVIRFPDVHEEAVCRIEFQRTLRIPDDNQSYSLPPGLGRFPLHHVDDHAESLPDAWNRHGGVFLPMYQSEALWINFEGDYPMAVKVAAGKIDAITGDPWHDGISPNPQNYLVLPDQPWMDGFCVGNGLIRQFVAMPLGEGYTAEEQLTGAGQHGGIQLAVYPMKGSEYDKRSAHLGMVVECSVTECEDSFDMGLAPGGLMHQEIYEDEYGFNSWETSAQSRCFVHILNSQQYLAVTGQQPPGIPPTAEQYSNAGLPWYDYYAECQVPLDGSQKLAQLDSLAVTHLKQGKGILPDNKPVAPELVKKLTSGKNTVREGEF